MEQERIERMCLTFQFKTTVRDPVPFPFVVISP